jgi:hypothetical protein
MKRILFSALLLTSVGLLLPAQNLVNNYSLETYSSCPTSSSQIAYATGWNASQNSPEYLNSCSSSIYADVPTGFFGTQAAATGNAYGGGLFYGSFAGSYIANLREFLYVTLSTPLTVGTTYYVAFKVNLVDNSEYAISHAGLQFCTSYNSAFPLNNTAHVYTTSVVSDKTSWTQVTGSIVPSVAYNALMVGNFFQDALCTVVFVGSSTDIGYNAYYFVDDVYVSTTPIVLPVSWVHTGVNVSGNVASVSWELEGEEVDYYTLEASDNGNEFAEVHQVQAMDGQGSYSQLDTMSHMATTFYRVRAHTVNGSMHLSPVIEAKRYEADVDFLLAYPSPVKQGQFLTVEYNTTSGHAAELQILSVDGRLVRTETLPETTAGHHEQQVAVHDLAPGAYILKSGSLTRKIMVTE